MSNVCDVTGVGAQSGNHVSHAHNKRKRRFSPNLHVHRFPIPGTDRSVKLKVSTKGIRIIDKVGILKVLDMIKARRQAN